MTSNSTTQPAVPIKPVNSTLAEVRALPLLPASAYAALASAQNGICADCGYAIDMHDDGWCPDARQGGAR